MGLAALGPIPWSAPEVCAGNTTTGTVATAASDVYMLGGLMFELLTSGDIPFFWLADSMALLVKRRNSVEGVRLPGARGMTVPGLRGKSVLQAAALDEEAITWRVKLGASPGSAARLQDLVRVMELCWHEDPTCRPKLRAL
jgi:hypothetical protein